jgi:acetyl esterase
MADYTHLIDAEIWAYIARTNACYPEDIVSKSIEEQRTIYNNMCRVFYRGRPEAVATHDLIFGGVPCREYVCGAPDKTVIYFHGGGFVVGGLDSHDDVCAELCDQTGLRVISVDYRLAPEHTYPDDFEDAWNAVQGIASVRTGPIILAGDSAGGALAASIAHQARWHLKDRIIGQVLIYPVLGDDTTKGSYLTHAQAPHLTRDDVQYYLDMRTGGATTGKRAVYALQDSDFSGLPPTIVFTAECDPLNDDGNTYCQAISAAGGRAKWVDEPGLIHGYLRARTLSAKAGASFARIVSALSKLGQGAWPG